MEVIGKPRHNLNYQRGSVTTVIDSTMRPNSNQIMRLSNNKPHGQVAMMRGDVNNTLLMHATSKNFIEPSSSSSSSSTSSNQCHNIDFIGIKSIDFFL